MLIELECIEEDKDFFFFEGSSQSVFIGLLLCVSVQCCGEENGFQIIRSSLLYLAEKD